MRLFSFLLALLVLSAATTGCKPKPKVSTADTAAAESLLEAGLLKARQGQLEAAIADYNAAILLDPSSANAYATRAGALGILQDYTGAIADYDQALEIDPNLAAAYGGRGLARYRNGDPSGGIADLERAADLFQNQGQLQAYQQTLATLERLKS
ncbi:tetratricopeptide repeat protein [Almyronema epifaneia]|uniref:Tetratricopeptide repeat protein n=1 Tax=Almyronema epifaneia S1 TaxID=2991925 RepID=A0ABW6I923_9CYAN